jgi:hypothetical protein
METYKTALAVGIPQEELAKWLKSPLTKALMRNINEYNKKYESKLDMPSIFIAAQWDTSTEYDNAIIHFAVMPH